jgi:DNA invertase Pin-like site-specific DNA recombinase
MAGLLAVFAGFEREILGERARAGLEHARQNGSDWANRRAVSISDQEITSRRCQQVRDRPQLQIGRTSVRRILDGHFNVK